MVMSNESNGNGNGTGTMYFDRYGTTQLLFGKVPANAVKRAFLTDKLGTVHTLLKMTYKSLVYDFTKSAKGGCVTYASNYSEWEFIAPDGRLRVDKGVYNGKTFVNGIRQLQSIVRENPIPAWDEFAVWMNRKIPDIDTYSSWVTVYINTPDNAVSAVCANNFKLTESTGFSDFLDDVITIVNSASGLPNMDSYLVDNTIQWILELKVMGKSIPMHFTFRE